MRIAVLGLGFMGSVHLRALREVAGAELAAVYSSDAGKLAGDLTAIRGNLGGPGESFDFTGVSQYHEITSLLADPSVEAVDLCLPTHLHEAVSVQALRAGKHVLVEKPMALDGASARRMIAVAKECNRTLMCAQVLRFFPEYAALRDALPRFGAVRTAFFRRRCAAPGWGGWLNDPARSGGGAFDLLIHDVDMCLHLFGYPEAVAATGSPDNLHAQLFYPFGTATVTGGWQHAASFPFSMEYSVNLEGGSLEFHSAGRLPTAFTETEERLPLDSRDGYAAEIDYFLECCRTGCAPDRCPPRESAAAIDLMRVLLTARERNGEKFPCLRPADLNQADLNQTDLNQA
jgi:predicted dehydrogenase